MRAIVILAVVLLAALVFAAASDTKFTADGGMTVSGYSSIEAIAYDGGCTLTLIDSPSTVVKTYYLRDSVARRFTWTSYTGIDSAYFDLTGASEVIATPE